MRAVLQRVLESSVHVEDQERGAIGPGLLVLLGVAQSDTEDDARIIAKKIAEVRCFADASSKFNLSVEEVGGSVLVISQFTLLGDCRKGRRPSFSDAAPPGDAIPLYEFVVDVLRQRGLEVQTGEFGAMMKVSLVNDGPVTLLLDSRKAF